MLFSSVVVLLKIYPLEMDAGDVHATGREYLAYTLAYGNIGICGGDETEMMKRYYMLPPLQEHYSMIPLKRIQYDHDGKFVNTSEAMIHGYNEKALLKLEYETGFNVYVNFDEEPWKFKKGELKLTLPQFEIYASTEDGESWAVPGMFDNFSNNGDIDIIHGASSHYLDTKGGYYNSESMSEKGQIAMKKEVFGWEIIPARHFNEFRFDPGLVGLNEINLKIQSIKKNGLPGNKVETRWSRGKYIIMGEVGQVLKVVPDVGIVPDFIQCKAFQISSDQELKIYLPSNLQSASLSIRLAL